MEELNSNKLLIAFLLAIAAYAVVYYVQFGQWCSAMWFGTYPLVFIAAGTSTLYKFLTFSDRIEKKRRQREEAEKAEFAEFTKISRATNIAPDYNFPPRNHW